MELHATSIRPATAQDDAQGHPPHPRRSARSEGAERRVVAALPDDLRGARDHAILTVGFGAARRRAEIVALDVPDLSFVQEGLEVLVRRSKTDQESEGFVVGIPFGSRWPIKDNAADGIL